MVLVERLLTIQGAYWTSQARLGAEKAFDGTDLWDE